MPRPRQILSAAVSAFAILINASFLSAAPADPAPAAWAALPPHPRLFANAARFEAIKSQDDPVSLQLRALIAYEAQKQFAAPLIAYLPTGFLVYQTRQAQHSILPLALSFRLTGNREHLERARAEILRLADLPDWRPAHFLGTGEAGVAIGIGYDWLYDELTPEERTRIERAIVRNLIEPSLAVPTGKGQWPDGKANWTQVCHAGLVVAALAIAEREPSLARQIVERAVTNFDQVGHTYYPDGAYPEGTSYWSYGTSFHVILIEALRTALGTSCGLETYPGFLVTGNFNNQMVGPTGEDYNFSDYHTENRNEPVMLWFARENHSRSLARDEFSDLARALEKFQTGANALPGKPVNLSRHLALGLLWWDPSTPEGADARARHWTAAGPLPLAVLRSAWDDRTASYLAIKGGTPSYAHGHMDVGSFVLEADGVRWAVDLGTENYDKIRAAKIAIWHMEQESTHWTTFRVGPESHSILRFDKAPQDVTGKAEITALPDAPDGTFGDVVELTPLYPGQVEHVTRTVRLHPDRTMSIADEWTTLAARPVKTTWQWLTRATVERTPDGVRLTQSAQSLTLRFEVPAGTAPLAEAIVIEDVSAPRAAQDSPNPGLTRIVLTMPAAAATTARLLVTAIPGSVVKP